MIHYHGTPLSPREVLTTKMLGRCFCVSFARPEDVKVVHEIGQSVMLDNGAYSFWRRGQEMDWSAYYVWCERWLEYPTTWAVIPDVIDGGAAANDALLLEWPFGTRGAPVWHLHEPIERLLGLADRWPRVCLGSSGDYREVGSANWHRRMEAAMNALCGSGPVPVWLHMLRGMSLSGSAYPFASVDSADIARNHNRPQNDAGEMVFRWDALQNPPRWVEREQLTLDEVA